MAILTILIIKMSFEIHFFDEKKRKIREMRRMISKVDAGVGKNVWR